MFKQSIIASAWALACIASHAASTDLAVEATITPEACAIALDGNGAVDYGTLPAATVKGYALWNGTHYALPTRGLVMKIDCAGPTHALVAFVDNMSASKETGLPESKRKFGLGDAGSSHVGFFEIEFKSVEYRIPPMGGMSSARTFATRSITGNRWDSNVDIVGYRVDQDLGVGLTFGPRMVPSSSEGVFNFSNLIATLEVSPRLSKSLSDALPSSVQMKGSSTILLEYL